VSGVACASSDAARLYITAMLGQGASPEFGSGASLTHYTFTLVAPNFQGVGSQFSYGGGPIASAGASGFECDNTTIP
jgi:hypothetical protein